MLKKLIKNKRKFFFDQRGMTLIELLVVISIFVIITSVIMFNYNNFRSSASTDNLVNDIALSIRKAQSAAIGVQGVNLDFQYAHGAHFSLNPNQPSKISGSNKSFILFTDMNNDDKYEYSDEDVSCSKPTKGNECNEILNINSFDRISAIYLDGIKKQTGMLDIVFRRPNPDALFCYRTEIGSKCQGASSIKIEVTNNQDSEDIIIKYVTVWNTGQISIQQ